jgi:hypothetical protein
LLLHGGLRRFACLVGGKAQIATRNEVDGVHEGARCCTRQAAKNKRNHGCAARAVKPSILTSYVSCFLYSGDQEPGQVARSWLP